MFLVLEELSGTKIRQNFLSGVETEASNYTCPGHWGSLVQSQLDCNMIAVFKYATLYDYIRMEFVYLNLTIKKIHILPTNMEFNLFCLKPMI